MLVENMSRNKCFFSSRFEYPMFYVLYPPVTNLLTFHLTLWKSLLSLLYDVITDKSFSITEVGVGEISVIVDFTISTPVYFFANN
jgi:hypothetical protein